ncbi:hypothetical protein C2E23DRAFT_349926 [Lenzites betulinus]|nr:hypothetical protein C2E23DRAFT_349926 [Lenzites betulinus]
MIIFRDCIAPVPLNLAIVLTTWSALHPQGRPGHINEYPKRFVAEKTCRQQATGLRSAATHMPRRVPRFMRSLTRTCVIILLGQSPCLIVGRYTSKY